VDGGGRGRAGSAVGLRPACRQRAWSKGSAGSRGILPVGCTTEGVGSSGVDGGRRQRSEVRQEAARGSAAGGDRYADEGRGVGSLLRTGILPAGSTRMGRTCGAWSFVFTLVRGEVVVGAN
jgi:hypothetical protein